jgi:hypothetical protein
MYKDQYLLEKVKEELDDIGYDKSFEILKPLTFPFGILHSSA